MRRNVLAAVAVLSAVSVPIYASAHNADCWGHGIEDTQRPDISCANLTESLVRRLAFVTPTQARKIMDAQGVDWGEGRLHFESNAGYGSKWTGDINIQFINGVAAFISGDAEGPGGSPSNVDFIWNSKVGLYCSDFPKSRTRCHDQ
jgi:hypothetical protein